MLEKIGLPAKPSMRGSNWVVDASHCQGCSSQFTFLNRKHHCRRCGGIFCNSCTQQRMNLRGQGDSPVRICDPCKKLEEAARFEMRHGHKNRTSKGSPKLTVKSEDEVLNQILGPDFNKSLSRGEATMSNTFSDFEGASNSASSSSFREAAVTSPVNTQNDSTEEIGPSSPDELLQQSLEEKKKYRILKGEGKSEEALRAFKRGKELERQAKALEVSLRKTSRKALSSNSLAGKTNEDSERLTRKGKVASPNVKENKNDLASELKELGWSDADLHDADKKPVGMSLEGELVTLLGGDRKKSGIGKGTGSIDKTQVVALKKKALLFKREGKLAEAKEELKKAKVLEKQLEEQEFLAEAEDSDDELSSLIRSMDDEKQDDLSLLDGQDAGFDFHHLVSVSDDLGFDGNLEVTEGDMEDPDIATALESLGWTEDPEQAPVPATQPVPLDGKALSDEVLALKREAVRQKRSGNVEEAMALLRKAKALERESESLQSQGNNIMAPIPMTEKISSQTSGNQPSRKVDDGMVGTSTYSEPYLQPKSKMVIQRELLGLKRKALALKREGRLDEAEEELRKGKLLECQLEEMENGSRVKATKVSASSKVSDSIHKQPGISEVVGLPEEDDEADVTDQDMQDPTMLKMLESLGWKDEDMQPKNLRPSNLVNSHPKDYVDPIIQSTTGVAPLTPKRNKAEIQRELLGLKRKALTLRRQGEIEEADEVLRKAKLLESQLEEVESSTKESPPYSLNMPTKLPEHAADPFKLNASSEITNGVAPRSKAEIQRELLGLKRKALTLRRQGETEEAEEVLKHAKLLEEKIEEMSIPKKELMFDSTNDENIDAGFPMSKEKNMISNDMVPEVATDFGWKNIANFPTNPSISAPTDDKPSLMDFDLPAEVKVVEDATSFPPSGESENLVDLLTGDMWHQTPVEEVENKRSFNTSILSPGNSYVQSGTAKSKDELFSKKVEKVVVEKAPVHETDSTQNSTSDLHDVILARKRKAVALKREGKIAEAREELRQAKLLEKGLEDKPQPNEVTPTDTVITTSSDSPPIVKEERKTTSPVPKPLTGRERFKMQQESLFHKRQALKLRREGRTEEAEAESELAKALEAQLEAASANEAEKMDDLGVEDLLDPQLLSALKAIGLQDAEVVPHATTDRPESSKPNLTESEESSQEKSQLEERIKVERMKAVTFKKAGKQAEALDALRRAKMYEKKLITLA